MNNEGIVHIFDQIVNLEEEFDENMITGKDTKENWRIREWNRKTTLKTAPDGEYSPLSDRGGKVVANKNSKKVGRIGVDNS